MTKTDIANLALSKLGEILIEDITDATSKAARLAALHYGPARRELLREHFWSFAMSEDRQKPVSLISKLYLSGFEQIDGNGVYVIGMGEDTGYNGITYPRFWNGNFYFYREPAALLVDDARWTLSTFGSSLHLMSSPSDVATPDQATDWTGFDSNGSFKLQSEMISLNGWDAAFPLPSDFLKLRTVRDDQGGKIEKFDLRRANDQRCLVAADYEAVTFDYVADVDDPDQYDPLFVAAFVTLLASKLARAITGSDQLETTLHQTYLTIDLPAARCADAQDSQSNENHPLREMLDGALTGQRGDFFPDLD